jgi:hypothetical protein
VSTLEAKCSACGQTMKVIPGVGAFAKAEVVGGFCPTCTDGLFLDVGGAVLTLRRDVDGSLFPLGKITITPGAVDALSHSYQHVFGFLTRHVRGDWGENGRHDQLELTDDERRRGWEATDDSGKINKSNVLRRPPAFEQATTTILLP